jgi:predicted nucleic acid-binding Zn ribbon protein
VHKLISAPAVHFKGTGWYVTDYAKKGSAPASESSSGGSSAPAAESKPAAPAAPKPAESK